MENILAVVWKSRIEKIPARLLNLDLSALSSLFSLLASLSLSRSLSCSLFCYRLYSIASTQTYTCTGWLSLVRDFDRDENVHDGFSKFLWIVLPLTRLSTSPPLIFRSTFVILFPVSFSTTSNDLYTFPFQITSLYYFEDNARVFKFEFHNSYITSIKLFTSPQTIAAILHFHSFHSSPLSSVFIDFLLFFMISYVYHEVIFGLISTSSLKNPYRDYPFNSKTTLNSQDLHSYHISQPLHSSSTRMFIFQPTWIFEYPTRLP